jgi:hypothetical protein
MNTIYVGDEGTELLLDCGVNISTATLVRVHAKGPKGNKKQWTAAVNGTTHVKRVVALGDFDVPGTWHVQAYVEMPGWKGRGEWAQVKVAD